MPNDKNHIFSEIDKKLGKSPEDIQDLFGLVRGKRGEIANLLNSNNLYTKENHINWYMFLADYREYLGIPRFIDLDIFNAFTEIIMTSGEEINYDDFLKVFKRSSTKGFIPTEYQGPNVSKLIQNQGEYIAQGLIELIANAIDATIPDKTIGRFGEGFYQSLKFIKDGKGEIVVTTKKDDSKGFAIHIINKTGVTYIGSVGIDQNANGTKVELKRILSKNEQESFKAFVRQSFKTNKKIKVILNNECINDISGYVYYNGERLSPPIQSVYIEITQNGFSIRDEGIGMSSQDLSEKLLYPNISGKKRLNPESLNDDDLNSTISNETSFFYKISLPEERGVKKYNQEIFGKTKIRLQVSGVLIEEFESKTSYDISEFCLDFPSFTWLPESRNSIELTKEVVLSLREVIEKITSQASNQKEQLILLEIVGKIISHLKSRDISNTAIQSKYDINKVSKTAFKKLKESIESSGIVILSAIDGIKNILGEDRTDIVYVDPQFLSFDIKKVPGIKKINSIIGATRDFYEIEFSGEAKYDYLILEDAILVNSKYIQDQESIDRMNTQINLNTNYEEGNDRVFYGTIYAIKGSYNKDILALQELLSHSIEQLTSNPQEAVSTLRELNKA